MHAMTWALYGLIMACALGMPAFCYAQDKVESGSGGTATVESGSGGTATVESGSGGAANVQDASSEMMDLANSGIAAKSASEAVENDQSDAEQPTMAQQMLAFFEGMMATVEAKSGNCQAMSDALQSYYHEHRAWISSLDYATGHLDAETLAAIHEKAAVFGKKLSVCYDQKSIPAQLHRYAGMGEEFE